MSITTITDEQKPQDEKPAKIKLNSATVSASATASVEGYMAVKNFLKGKSDLMPEQTNLDNIGDAIDQMGSDCLTRKKCYAMFKGLLPEGKYSEFTDPNYTSPKSYVIGDASHFTRVLEDFLRDDTISLPIVAMWCDAADRIDFPPRIATKIAEMRREAYRKARKDIMEQKAVHTQESTLSSFLAARSNRARPVKDAKNLKGRGGQHDVLNERAWKESLAKRKTER